MYVRQVQRPGKSVKQENQRVIRVTPHITPSLQGF